MSDVTNGPGQWPPPPPPSMSYAPPPGEGTPPSVAPDKSPWWKRSVPLWSLVVVALVGLLVGVAAGGSGSDEEAAPSSETIETEARSNSDGDDEAVSTSAPTSTTTTSRPTTTRPVTTTTAPPEQGTRENPYPTGAPLVTTDGVEVSVASVNLDANAAIAAENRYNDAPPEGSRFVLVNVSMTNGGSEPVTPWIEIDVQAIGSGNTVHGSCGQVHPDSLMDAPELYPGGAASGNVCVVVPNAEVDDGSLLIMVGPRFGEPVFVRP